MKNEHRNNANSWAASTSSADSNSLVGLKRGAREVFREGRVLITREECFSHAVITFLDQVTWGTESNLFRHIDTADRINNLIQPIFFVMRIDGKISATLVIECRDVIHHPSKTASYYFRYFASGVAFRNRRLVGLYSHKFMDLVRSYPAHESIFFGVVDRGNVRSRNINIKMGQESIATIKMLGFSRVFPKSKITSTPAHEEELAFVRAHLAIKYRDHILFHNHYVGHRSKYFVYKENGVIVAGLQIFHARWVIEELPGTLGKMAIRFGHRIPLFNRIFNAKDFDFLAVDSIYYQDGRANLIPQLIESVLSREGKNAALMWFDSQSPIGQELSRLQGFGLLNYFAEKAELDLFATFRNFHPAKEQQLKSRPVYISSFDFI